jgi:arylsulfatase A-like enzyme
LHFKGRGIHVGTVYRHPVELLDLFPTLLNLAGLPAAPSSWKLAGTDLTRGMVSLEVVKPENAAFSQITRCYNCTRAYGDDSRSYQGGCVRDAVDAQRYTVPCAQTPPAEYDFMGMSVRTSEWRCVFPISVFEKHVPWLQISISA